MHLSTDIAPCAKCTKRLGVFVWRGVWLCGVCLRVVKGKR